MSDWSRVRLKFLTSINDSVLPENTDPDFEFTYFDIGDAGTGRLRGEGTTMTFAAAPSRARRIAAPGDVLVSTVRTYLRAIVPVPTSLEPIVFSTGFAVIHPDRNKLDPRFLAYRLLSTDFVEAVVARSVGVSYPAITPSQLGHISITVPQILEQRAIADFLDRETAQIDAMIGAQESLMASLRERRAAVISRAVEPELNNWPTGRIRNLGRVTLGKMLASRPSSSVDEELPYLRAANVQPDGVLALEDLKSMWFTPREQAALTLKAGDVVVVEGGQGGFGRAAYLRSDLPGVAFQNSINRIRPHEGNDGRFITYSLLSARTSGLMHALCPAVSMPHLTAEKLKVFPVSVPTPTQQREAADYLDRIVAHTDQLLAAAHQTVALMHKHREALITSAVTGRIDLTTGMEHSALEMEGISL